MVVGYWYWVEPGAPSAHVSTHVNLPTQLPLSLSEEQGLPSNRFLPKILSPIILPRINPSEPNQNRPEVLFLRSGLVQFVGSLPLRAVVREGG